MLNGESVAAECFVDELLRLLVQVQVIIVEIEYYRFGRVIVWIVRQF